MDAIKSDLVAKSLLPSSASFQKTQDYLRVCSDDLKPKVIYLSAAHNPNGGLDPKRSSPLLSAIAENFDLQFKYISSYESVCQTIANASKTGTIAAVVIDSLGTPNNLLLSETIPPEGSLTAPRREWISENKDFATCFSALKPSGKVIFAGGSSGATQAGDRNNNIAQKVATKAGITVFAPVGGVCPEKRRLLSTNPFTIFHPSEDDPTVNTYREFLPGAQPSLNINPNCLSKDCVDLNKNAVHPRELAAIDAITSTWWNLFGKPDFKTTQEHLRFNTNDQREEFLFLSAKEDSNDWLNPRYEVNVLAAADSNYDLKFKLVESKADICREMKDAARIGKVAHVFLHAPSNANAQAIMLAKSVDWSGWLSPSDDFSCLSDLQPSGTIILKAPLGPINSKVKLPQIIADQTNRTVFAATNDEMAAATTQVTSSKPFQVFHPAKNDPKKNAFQSFYPINKNKARP